MPSDLLFVATCDLVGLTRGRSFVPDGPEQRAVTGVGWVPADLALTTFGPIAEPNPFGSLGDLRLVPVGGASATLPAGGGRPSTRLQLASIVEVDGSPWRCCPRTALVHAARELGERFGLRLRVAFEQEFTLLGLESPGAPFSLEAHRRAEPFGSVLVEALERGGLEPETWLPEYGPGQFEITLAPADPVTAADRAILVRALVRDLASAAGHRATFAPLLELDGVGNGVHVHLSLWRGDEPLTMTAEALTPDAGAFAAGIVDHAEAVVGWTAPSVVSPLRLTPHRWSAAATFVGRQNREALIRVIPGPTFGGGEGRRGANLEYRASDASANPWLALAAIVRAGIDGLERSLTVDVVDGELDALDEAERERRSIRPLPGSVEAAMEACEQDEVAAGWFDRDLLATHVAIRRTEASILADLDDKARCDRYAAVL